MPTYERGHAKNCENFAKMILFVNGYGAAYQPVNGELSIASLEALLEEALLAMADLRDRVALNKVAINDRKMLFDGVRPRMTKAVSSFAVSGASKEAVNDAKGYKRKLDGRRAEPKVDDPSTPETEGARSISASQQSYAQLVEHLDNLLAIMDADGNYNPNENDIKMTALQALSADLKTANTAVMTTYTPRSSALIARNNALYGVEYGIVDRALLVKQYVKSVFGAASPEYKQISRLAFTRPTQ